MLELTTTTAPYKGKAAALVPYLGVSNFSGGVPLMEFEALTLNTDYLVLSGSMRAITDPVLRKKLTDQRNQKDASKENQQTVAEKKYQQPVTGVAIKKDTDGKPVLNEKGQPTAVVTLADGTTKEELVTQNTSFVGSDGNQVTISSGGVMMPADGKPGARSPFLPPPNPIPTPPRWATAASSFASARIRDKTMALTASKTA